jgi:hypothetical protein
MRNTDLTSTYVNEFDKHANLSNAERIKRSPRALKGVARGVLLGFGAALCFMPAAGSTSANKEYISYKEYALYLLDFNVKEYKCLATLYGKESAWNPNAVNGSHYGIPQGNSEWLKDQDGYTQVVWGLNYIGARYGEPCVALGHWSKYGWH